MEVRLLMSSDERSLKWLQLICTSVLSMGIVGSGVRLRACCEADSNAQVALNSILVYEDIRGHFFELEKSTISEKSNKSHRHALVKNSSNVNQMEEVDLGAIWSP
jgi:hypothetical protein